MDCFCSILVLDSFIQYIVTVPLQKAEKRMMFFGPFGKKQKSLRDEEEEGEPFLILFSWNLYQTSRRESLFVLDYIAFDRLSTCFVFFLLRIFQNT